MSDDPTTGSLGFVAPFGRYDRGVAWGRHPAAIDREPLPVPDYVAARLPPPLPPLAVAPADAAVLVPEPADEQAVPEPIEEEPPATAHDPPPADRTWPDWVEEPESALAAARVPPRRGIAYWAEAEAAQPVAPLQPPDWPRPDAGAPLAWLDPLPSPDDGEEGAAAPAAADERLWPLEHDGEERRPSGAVPARRGRRVLLAAAAVVLLGVAGGVAWRRFPGLFGGANGVDAVFNAPMLVIRAAVAGRVGTITANAGDTVDPSTRLLTVRSDRSGGWEQPVLAGLHGVVRSVETVPGTDVAVGSPLVRIQDCDRAFLTVPASAKLQEGDTVEVRLPNLPAMPGAVRASAGIMEPPNTVVVALRPGALGGTCPVGAKGIVVARPATTGLQS